MTKPTIVKLFVGSIVAVFAAVVLGFIVLWYAYANDAFAMNGPDVTGIESSPFAWTVVVLLIIATGTLIGGFIAGLVSWIGALLNTAQLADKTWFVLLLVLGLLSFGFLAMIAYVIGGPDGVESREGPAPHPVT